MSSPDAAATGRDGDHEARALEALRRALAGVPFYARHAPQAEVAGTLEDTLRRLPLLTRKAMRSAMPRSWAPEGRDVKAELSSGRVLVLETGTANDRVRVLWEDGELARREREALDRHPVARAAIASGGDDYRDAVLFVPERGTGSCGSGDPTYEDRVEGARLFLNSRQAPTFWTELVMDRMLDELASHRTTALFADPFYLDVLARHAASRGRTIEVSGFVALTRALTTSAHRAALASVCAAPTLQLFGSRETGPLFVEGEDGLLHHGGPSTHVELLRARVPTPGAEGLALVVVTSIDRELQPLVRYVTGDLVRVAPGDHVGASVPPLVSVEGKLEDAIVRPDGAIVSPAALDRALAAASIGRFQATQHSAADVDLDVVDGDPAAAQGAAAGLLSGMNVRAQRATALSVEANGKLKITRRRWAAATDDAFGDDR